MREFWGVFYLIAPLLVGAVLSGTAICYDVLPWLRRPIDGGRRWLRSADAVSRVFCAFKRNQFHAEDAEDKERGCRELQSVFRNLPEACFPEVRGLLPNLGNGALSSF